MAFTYPWEPAGTLSDPSLYRPTALALPDGRVLALGPAGGRSVAELWDPSTRTWRETNPVPRYRAGFAAVVLRDGRVLVAGGLDGEGPIAASYSSAYVFDSRSGHEDWTKVGLMRQARTDPASVVLPDGRVLVAGGYFSTGPIESRADPPGAQEPAIVLAAYRPGGSEPGSVGPLDDVEGPPVGYALATAELFDPVTGAWSPTGPMRFARVGAVTAVLADGRVLVVGGAVSDGSVIGQHPSTSLTAEIYDPGTGRFTLTDGLPEIDLGAFARIGAPPPGPDRESWMDGSLVALADGSALLLGNGNEWIHHACAIRTLRFDGGRWSVAGETWVSWREIGSIDHLTSPGTSRWDAYVALLPDGRVLVAGGRDGCGEATRGAEVLDLASRSRALIPDLPGARAGGMAVPLPDGSVLLIGGWGYDGFAPETILYAP